MAAIRATAFSVREGLEMIQHSMPMTTKAKPARPISAGAPKAATVDSMPPAVTVSGFMI